MVMFIIYKAGGFINLFFIKSRRPLVMQRLKWIAHVELCTTNGRKIRKTKRNTWFLYNSIVEANTVSTILIKDTTQLSF